MVAARFTAGFSIHRRSFVGEFSDFAIRAIDHLVAMVAHRRFVAACFGCGVARDVAATVGARRSFTSSAAIAVAASSTTASTFATTTFTVAAIAPAAVTAFLTRLAGRTQAGISRIAEVVGAFAVEAFRFERVAP